MTSYSNILTLIPSTGPKAIDLVDNKATLTVTQALDLASQGVSFAGNDVIKVADSAATVEGLTATQIASLKTLGVDSVLANDAVLDLDLAQVRAFAAQDITASTEYPTQSATTAAPEAINDAVVSMVIAPNTAALANGGYAIAYMTTTSGVNTTSLRVRLFDDNGTATGDSILINEGIDTNGQPSITPLKDGGMVLVWTTRTGLYQQMLDSQGHAVGTPEALNTGRGYAPTTTALSDGGYMVVWTGNSLTIKAARYDASGELVGTIQSLTTTSIWGAATQGAAGATTANTIELGNGNVLVLWDDYNIDGPSGGLGGQIIDTSGQKIGDAFIPAVNVDELQYGGQIAKLDNGTVVVVWASQSTATNNGDIAMRILDATGTPIGNEIFVTSSGMPEDQPVITALEGGGFVVSWMTIESAVGPDGTYYPDMGYRVYDASGNAVTGELLIQSTDFRYQRYAQIVAIEGGGFVVAWREYVGNGEDRLYGQVFDAAGNKVGAEISMLDYNLSSFQLRALDGGGFTVTIVANSSAHPGIFKLTFAHDADAATLSGTASALSSLSSTDAQNLAELGIVKLTVSDGGSVVLAKAAAASLIAGSGIHFDGAAAVTVSGTGAALDDFSASDIAALKALGVTGLDASDNAVTLTLAQANAYGAAALAFAASDTVTVVLSSTEFADLTSSDITRLAGIGADVLDISGNAVSLTLARISALQTAGLAFVSGDVVTLSDTAARIAALTVGDIGQLAEWGVDRISPSDGSVTLSIAQANAIHDAGIVFTAASTVVVAGNAATVAAFSIADIAELGSIGVDTVSISGDVSLSVAQIEAFNNNNVSLEPGANKVMIVDTGAHIAAMSAADIAALADLGITDNGTIWIDVSDNSLAMTFAQIQALEAVGARLANGDKLLLKVTTDGLAALSSADLNDMVTAGATSITASSDIDVSLVTMARVNAAGMTFGTGFNASLVDTAASLLSIPSADLGAYRTLGMDAIKLSDSAANIAALTSASIAALDAMGVGAINVTSASITISLAKALQLAELGMVFDDSDVVIVSATSTTLADPDTFDLPGLQSIHVDRIDASDNKLALSLGQAQIYTGAGIGFTPGDVVTVDMTLSEARSLSRSAGNALRAAGVDTLRIDLSPTDIKALTTSQIAAFGAAGINAVDIEPDAVVLSAAQIKAFATAGIAFASDDVVKQHLVPSLKADTATASEHATPKVSVLANDTVYDGLKLTVKTATVSSGNGKVVINKDGTLSVTYTGADIDASQKATVVIYYTAQDGIESASSKLTVTFNGVTDTLNGTNGNDTIRGSEAAQIIKGLGGNDTLYGNGGNDTLYGGAGNDVLKGGNGHDVLYGEAGNDRLYGDAGNDTLYGGTGLDDLYGGTGADRFIFKSVSELGTTKTATDTIFDFNRSQGDRIDLSAIDANTRLSGDQSFAFIGSGAFSKVAGQLRFDTSGSKHYVYGDVNGDGKADFVLEVYSSTKLVASDFIL